MTRLFLWKFNAANKSFQTKEAASNENQQNVEASPSASNYNITLNCNFSILILFYLTFTLYLISRLIVTSTIYCLILWLD